MGNIKILDCTLRDGGYINNWNFGLEKAKKMLHLLDRSDVDYIEVGFIQDCDYTKDKTLFDSLENIKNLVCDESISKKIMGMITYGKFPIAKIPNSEKSIVKQLRVIFKKEQKDEALKYCQQVQQRGYDVFINPTFTDQYSDTEIIELSKRINNIHPKGMTIVDSMGVLKKSDMLRLFYLIDNNLDKDIALCFHSHNNLQLSFPNAQTLIEVCKDRELIIDSTLFGMGRGAGNLCTELLVEYLNDNYGGHYDIIPILKAIDEQINPIFAKTPWGYSVPYYLAAINHCHPNYAKFLVDKQTVPVEHINLLLQSIPDEKKSNFQVDVIKQIYLDKFSNVIDDSKSIEEIKKLIFNKELLILAPGKSLETEKVKVENFIKQKNPYIISLNFAPEFCESDLLFITNIKRFSNLKDFSTPMVITSNIEDKPEQAMILNYSSYLNNSKMFDNVALMLLTLLKQIGIKDVNIAGLDGFSKIASENYVSADLINNSRLGEFDERNQIMSEELTKFNDFIKLNFITTTQYTVQRNYTFDTIN